jgi:3-methylfumaryl-CoA hydratase
MSEIDIENLRGWIGREEKVSDRLLREQANQMSAILDWNEPGFTQGSALPLGWQWIYFNPVVRSADLDVDGHPKRGGFLPPVPLPRRMWASGSMVLHAPLKVDVPAERRSTIDDVALKEGRSGPLVFVTLRHEYWQEGGLALSENQSIVYRDMPKAQVPIHVAPGEARQADWSKKMTADEVLLFRYSAVTFNGHRIHHDERYVKDVEGYPGLVVHGPLLATLLIDFLSPQVDQERISEFSFKAQRPLFAHQEFILNGARKDEIVDLWIEGPDGHVAMSGSARLTSEGAG